MQLKAGVAGKAQLKIGGKGALLGLPALPLAQDQRVRVQLRNNEGHCWQAGYVSATKNDGETFSAKSE